MGFSHEPGTITTVTTVTSVVDDVASNEPIKPKDFDKKGPLGLNLLSNPPEPHVDFIFVHGLGGGSRKTWSFSEKEEHFWPKYWLPKDPAFKNVRIHSFGYSSDWFKGRDSAMEIQDFAMSLLIQIITSPGISDGNTPIVLIGHSMGGLVIKKMYIIARQNKLYEAVARRIRTIYFVATPHSGSHSSELLLGIFHAAFGSRSYVTDLEQGSAAIQDINERFYLYSGDLDLWSFYETLPLTIGPLSKMIVRRDSATLGYKEENQVPLTADHRSICKFSTPDDPNYKALRNALEKAVQTLDRMRLESKKILRNDQITELEKYLGVSAAPHGDLLTAQDARLAGTCVWLSEKKNFLKWRDFLPNSPSIFWLSGNPGAGKSVLAGYIIDHLKQRGSDVSYFFFKYGDDSKTKLSACLRSIAFQMARNNTQALDLLLKMESDGVSFDHGDERTIWMQVFMSGIFQAGFSNHYWIIDALDECVDLVSFFVTMLAKLDKAIPLRVLITSRTSAELQKQFSNLGVDRFLSQRISTEDTLPDIKLLLEGKSHLLAGKDDKFRAALVDKILNKSNDSFLWTTLVLHQLRNAHSMEEVSSILEDVPREMEPLYMRTLQSISRDKYGRDLAKAVLDWTICAVRPLTVGELEAALKLGQNTDFLDLAQSITNVCGQLVNVDKLGRVQMVHTTARQFLANENLESEFAVKKTEVHTRITKVCLAYLTSKEMEPTGTRRSNFITFHGPNRNKFETYIFNSFSDHLVQSDPRADDVLALLDTFLRRNMLSWIHAIAETQNLEPLFRVAKSLGAFLDKATLCRPLDNTVQTIRGWAKDLVCLVAKFGDALLGHPSAIYQIILPFSPKESTIYKTCPGDSWLTVTGDYTARWDDLSCCMKFNDGIRTMCHGDQYFAILFNTGLLVLYHETTYQKYKVLDADSTAWKLAFQSRTDLIASCSGGPDGIVRVWNIHSGETIHHFNIDYAPCWLGFCGELLVVISVDNHIICWNLRDGLQCSKRLLCNPYHRCEPQLRPHAIAVSPDHKLFAIGYEEHANILLWNVEESTYYGCCEAKVRHTEHPGIHDLIFRPNSATYLLAVSYQSGDLILLQPDTNRIIKQLNRYAQATSLTASPDGGTLVGAFGPRINIYEFTTLRLLDSIIFPDFYWMRSPTLAFGNDNFHFFQIAADGCNIWEPAALTNRDLGNGGEKDMSYRTAPVHSVVFDTKCHFAFCGYGEGSVTVLNLETGDQAVIFKAEDFGVSALSWSPDRNALTIALRQDRRKAWLTSLGLWNYPRTGWAVESRIFSQALPIGGNYDRVQLLAGPNGNILVSTDDRTLIFSSDGKLLANKGLGVMQWIQHPSSPLHVIGIETWSINLYPWSDMTLITSVHIDENLIPNSLFYPSFYGTLGHNIVAEMGYFGHKAPQSVYYFDSSFLNLENLSGGLLPTPRIRPIIEPIVLEGAIDSFLGIWKSKVIFSNHDSWICSAEPDNFDGSYQRHFFVPKDWITGNEFSKTKPMVSAAGHVVFTRNGEFAIIKGGFEYGETVEVLRSSSSSFVSAVEEQVDNDVRFEKPGAENL
ncbi:hypothetical protein FQN55_003446 [Onygenales sp. PD_40]|nr:hypothetical protein FQN55_003446 [Onygenales sp. PD_40]